MANIANGIFPDKKFEVNQEYLGKIRTYFKAEVHSLDYSNPSAAAKYINDYAAKVTNNLIKDVISSDNLG